MAKMSDPRKLFLHELGQALNAENQLMKTLPKLAKEATDPQLRRGFRRHLTETRRHAANIEKAFAALGKKPKVEKSPAIKALKKEHDRFMRQQNPSAKIRNQSLTGVGAHAEHYEIAAYTSLVTSAEALGETKCAKLLRQNLAQDRATLEKLESTGKRLVTAGNT